jgi:dolichyl-phosphate-mannose-protein mannosyltransferase
VDVEVAPLPSTKDRLKSFCKWDYFWLYALVIVTLVLHFVIINDPGELILDEQHYVGDARNIIGAHADLRPEHPPLAKLFVLAGITLFGDNAFGWRFFSVIFGTILLVLFYLICRKLGMSRNTTSLATFLLSFENFTFVQAGVAMLDVYFVTFMLLCFLLYLYREYLLSGASMGLSSLCKLYGALAGPAIFIHWIVQWLRAGRPLKSLWFLGTAVAAPAVFLALMPAFDYIITGSFQNPIDRVKEMLSLSSSLTFANTTHIALSRPWQWVIEYRPMAYWYTPHYTGGISPTIWALIIPAFAYMIFRAIKGNEAGLFGAAWFFGTYVLWIPISIITDRISFVYYIYPSIGPVCLGVALGISHLWQASRSWQSSRKRAAVKYGILTFLMLHVAAFLILSPLTNWVNLGIKG